MKTKIESLSLSGSVSLFGNNKNEGGICMEVTREGSKVGLK